MYVYIERHRDREGETERGRETASTVGEIHLTADDIKD